MPCSGDSTTTCGGPDAITLFQNPDITATSTTSAAPDATSSTTSATSAAATVALPSGWSAASATCLAEGTNGRALAGASTADGAMTVTMCLNFCQSKGFQYAGIEYSGECYCAGDISNGASLSVSSPNCNMPCSGESTETCGGPGALSLYVNPSLARAATTTANGFSQQGCIQEVPGRALSGSSTSSPDMTLEKCTSCCGGLGFSMAGIEYGQECYCGNELANGASLSLSSGQCNMPCAGDRGEICGGPNAIALLSISSS